MKGIEQGLVQNNFAVSKPRAMGLPTGFTIVIHCILIPEAAAGFRWQNVGSNPGRDTCVLEQDT